MIHWKSDSSFLSTFPLFIKFLLFPFPTFFIFYETRIDRFSMKLGYPLVSLKLTYTQKPGCLITTKIRMISDRRQASGVKLWSFLSFFSSFYSKTKFSRCKMRIFETLSLPPGFRRGIESTMTENRDEGNWAEVVPVPNSLPHSLLSVGRLCALLSLHLDPGISSLDPDSSLYKLIRNTSGKLVN